MLRSPLLGLKSLSTGCFGLLRLRVKMLDKEKPQEVEAGFPLCLDCIVLEEGFKSCSHLSGLKASFESSL